MLSTLIRDILKAVPELDALMAHFEGQAIEARIEPITRVRVQLGKAPRFWRIRDNGVVEPVFQARMGDKDVDSSPVEAPEPRLVVSGSPGDFLAFLRTGQVGKLRFEGDSAFAVELLKELKSLDINWIQRLSPYLGEELLGSVVQVSGFAWQWFQRVRGSFWEDMQEYLHYEARLVPPPEQAREWLEQTERVRQNADRLDARIDQLEKRRKEPPSQ